MTLFTGQGPDANGPQEGSTLGILVRSWLSHGHVTAWGCQGGASQWDRPAAGHFGSPEAACTFLHGIGLCLRNGSPHTRKGGKVWLV